MHPIPDFYAKIRDDGFPTVEALRRGVILDCIGKAYWLVTNEPVFEAYWEGDTFLEDELQGERWSVSFPPAGGAVAVFYSSESPRNPYPEGSPPYDQSVYFQGMPQHLISAKARALQWMQDLEFEVGRKNAVITAAMWADKEQFTAAEPWDDVLHHSLWSCCPHLQPLEVALQSHWDGMQLPGDGMEAMCSLFERRIASTDDVIFVNQWEWQTFLQAAEGQIDPQKLAIAQALLKDIGIAFPAKTP